MTSLNQLLPGQEGRLVCIQGERAFRRRLMEMGLLPGTVVRLVRRMPFGGLVELEVRGGHLSLRSSEVGQLMVELG